MNQKEVLEVRVRVLDVSLVFFVVVHRNTSAVSRVAVHQKEALEHMSFSAKRKFAGHENLSPTVNSKSFQFYFHLHLLNCFGFGHLFYFATLWNYSWNWKSVVFNCWLVLRSFYCFNDLSSSGNGLHSAHREIAVGRKNNSSALTRYWQLYPFSICYSNRWRLNQYLFHSQCFGFLHQLAIVTARIEIRNYWPSR